MLAEPFWKNTGELKALTPEWWRGEIGEHAGDIWSVPKLGPPPGDRECVVPQEIIDELRLTEKYDQHGIKRRTWVEESEHDRQLKLLREQRERERREEERLDAIMYGGR